MTDRRALSRRLFAGGLAAALLIVAACGGDDADSATGSTTGNAATTTAAAPTEAAFPVTVDHAFGATTVAAAPRRLVIVGYKEQDYFLALGVVPIAIREWFGGQPSATWPWAQSYLDGATPEVLPRTELNYEQIAGLHPDLIVGLSAGLTQEEYDGLSAIAPTIAQPSSAGDFDVTWQDMTRLAGTIVGESARAEELVTDLEGRIADVRAAHPEFEGATTVLASAVGAELYLYGPGATASQVLLSLGLVMEPEVESLTDNADAFYIVSEERFDLFDVSLAVWSEAATDEGPQALLTNPLYENLEVRRAARDVFLGEANGAFVFSSVLSLPYVLDEVVPQFALAADGDPATISALGAP